MHTLPQQLANGLILGSMYGLIAIGYTMVYGIVQLINFAHGEIFMTGGFGASPPISSCPTAYPCGLPSPHADRRRTRRRPHRRGSGTVRLPTTREAHHA